MPDAKTAEQTTQWLHSAVDTGMMKHLKKIAGSRAYSTQAASIEDVDARTYSDLQKLVREDIRDNFQNSILPVQWDDIMWRQLNR